MAGLKLAGPDPASKARALLDAAGLMIEDARPIQHAMQFRLSGGVFVNVFTSTGSVVVQGKGAGAVDAALAAAARSGDIAPAGHPSSLQSPVPATPPKVASPRTEPPDAPVQPNPKWIGNWADWDGASPPW